jgi:hypothetical protein
LNRLFVEGKSPLWLHSCCVKALLQESIIIIANPKRRSKERRKIELKALVKRSPKNCPSQEAAEG